MTRRGKLSGHNKPRLNYLTPTVDAANTVDLLPHSSSIPHPYIINMSTGRAVGTIIINTMVIRVNRNELEKHLKPRMGSRGKSWKHGVAGSSGGARAQAWRGMRDFL